MIGGRRWHLARELHALRSGVYRLGTEDLADHRQPVRHEVVTHVSGAYQPSVVAGVGFEPTTFRL